MPTSQFAPHVTLIVCPVTEKGSSCNYPCSHHIFLTSLSETIQDRKNSCSFVILVYCQLYLVTNGFHRKNIRTTTPTPALQQGEGKSYIWRALARRCRVSRGLRLRQLVVEFAAFFGPPTSRSVVGRGSLARNFVALKD